MNTAAIASHLNILESAITRCEEWANVIFCVVRGIGARFVSKKVVKVMPLDLFSDDLYFPDEDTNDRADEAENLSNEFANLECISQGSHKQIKWASDIFANTACDYYARRVLSGDISRSDAEKLLRNSSAKWWIDNRGIF